jgi:hypothetical protein
MDPIRRTSGPSRPQDVPASSGPAPATGPSPAFGAAPTGGIARPEFNRIAARINEGLARKQSRDEIMQDVIASETRERFGPLASPGMAASVAESFRTDPALTGLVARLFAAAAA